MSAMPSSDRIINLGAGFDVSTWRTPRFAKSLSCMAFTKAQIDFPALIVGLVVGMLFVGYYEGLRSRWRGLSCFLISYECVRG